MTVTDTETSHASSSDVSSSTPSTPIEPGAFERALSWLSSGDHKDIGRKWIFLSFDFAVVIFVVGFLVGLERMKLDNVNLFGGIEASLQMWTLYRLGFVFLVVVPLVIGLATVIVPMQVGAPSVSYPRLLAASFWTWMVSSVIFTISHFIDGGFVPAGNKDSVELTVLSFFFMVLAVIVAAGCLVTTVITQRTAGMSLARVPMFAWSILVACSVWMLTLPVLLANLVVIWIDLDGTVGEYGSLLYNQLGWVVGQPQVFAFALPLLGIAADIVPTAFSARPRAYGVTQTAIGMFGLLSFGAYAQGFFYSSVTSSPVYVLGALTLVVPIVLILGSWADAARRSDGGPTPSSHLLMAILAVVSLLGAGAIAAVRVLGALLGFLREFGRDDESWQADLDDFLEPLQLANTSIEGAVFNGVIAAALIGVIAGIWFWAPKIFGQQLNPGIGALAGLTLSAGAILTAVPDAIAAFLDQPDFAVITSVEDGVEAMNLVSLIGRGALLGGIGLALLGVGMVWLKPARWDADVDPDNPVGGHTLEWATTTPVPRGNFSAPIAVTSERPLLDMAQGEAS